MPASITIALVALSPKVIGRRIEMPASGPMPGSTPTTVPTRQPRNAYHSTAGCSATEKPSSRLCSVSMSEAENAGFERRLERHTEQQPREQCDADAVNRGRERMAPLGPEDEREQQERHRDDEAERLIRGDRDRSDDDDGHRM